MLPKHDQHYLHPSGYTRRTTTFIDREFQLKYTRYILWMAAFITLLFLLPPFYYAYQNYTIFINLADLNDPGLSHYLLTERFDLCIYFAIAGLAQFAFWFLFSKRMSAKIVGPAKLLRNHLRLVSRGDFSLPVLQIRQDDEFKELVSSYNYLYTLLKVQSQRDLEDLLSMRKIVSHPGAVTLLNEMIRTRALRLGLDPKADGASTQNGNRGAKPATSPDSRHAS